MFVFNSQDEVTNYCLNAGINILCINTSSQGEGKWPLIVAPQQQQN